MTKIGFIGLGNVGGKLAGSILRNGMALMVRDLDRNAAAPFLEAGAQWADSPKAMAEACDIVITCLPSPAASSAVMEADDGILAGISAGKVWAEMSTTDEAEVKRLGEKGAGGWRGSGGLSGVWRLSSGCHGQHRHFCRMRSGCFRSAAAGADHSGTPRSAHRAAWLGIGLEGGDQLFGNS